MKILKRNQIIIFVIALMLVSAGYLNYTANNKESNTISTSGKSDDIQYAGIGDAKLVNSNGVIEENMINEENIIEGSVVENSKTNEQINNIVSTSGTNNDEYFKSSRLTRDTMYSQMLDTYQKILESQTISSDQKSIAQTEIKNINDMKNKIMICENLIKTKGISELVIFINDGNISVIVKDKDLKQEQIAQIQNIISREMQAEIDNIHISSK